MDFKHFKAPFISIDAITEAADGFRQKNWPSNELPVDIDAIVEFELGLEIRPLANIKENTTLDALLLGNLSTIVVDLLHFDLESYQNRMRFSLAHEVGHLVLHKDIYSQIDIKSPEDWIGFIQQVPEKEYEWVERHADEFAGRLLVPGDHLTRAVERAVKLADEFGFSAWDKSGATGLEYVAHEVAPDFMVSEDVIQIRMRREKLLD